MNGNQIEISAASPTLDKLDMNVHKLKTFVLNWTVPTLEHEQILSIGTFISKTEQTQFAY